MFVSFERADVQITSITCEGGPQLGSSVMSAALKMCSLHRRKVRKTDATCHRVVQTGRPRLLYWILLEASPAFDALFPLYFKGGKHSFSWDSLRSRLRVVQHMTRTAATTVVGSAFTKSPRIHVSLLQQQGACFTFLWPSNKKMISATIHLLTP